MNLKAKSINLTPLNTWVKPYYHGVATVLTRCLLLGAVYLNTINTSTVII